MPSIAGSKVLVTGGAGFVGSHITDVLVKEGVGQVVLLDNMLRGRLSNLANHDVQSGTGPVTLVDGDIRDQPLVDRLVSEADFCVHLAATRITRCAERPREALEIMFDGAFNVFEACVKHNITKVVAASSASVYGGAEDFPTTESHHPYHNTTLYGAGKVANEGMLRAFHHGDGLVYNAMRFFNIYGSRMDTHGRYTEVLIRWYFLIKKGVQPLIFGDGQQTMDFVYVTDVARACVSALSAPTVDDVYNIASGVETNLVELCTTLLSVMGSDLQPAYRDMPAERKGVEVSRRLASTDKARRDLGFEATIDLCEGLELLVGWLDGLEPAEFTK